MPSEKLVVSAEEIEGVTPQEAATTVAKPPPSPIPVWARIGLWLLVPILPVLCVVATILKIAFRTQPPRVRAVVASFLSTLLIVSGLLATIAGVMVFSFVPIPAIVNTGMPELDERTDFPALNPNATLSSSEVSARLKPLVIVVSPAARMWSRQEVPSNMFGAGMLLEANADGYLFATANHVAEHDEVAKGGKPAHVMVTTAAGVWSTADVIGTAAPIDVALLWVPRQSGHGVFVQPLAAPSDGEAVFVIGHPEGLRYTLSTGLVSGLRDQLIQISAAISPGNSGGPVYDTHGSLIGIVSSKFDKNRDANAENLGFAASAQVLSSVGEWKFYGNGRKRLETYLNDLKNASPR